MASGSNVGSVSVSVVPDAQGFGARLAAQVLPDAVKLGQQIGRVIGDEITSQLRSGIQQGLLQGGAGVQTQGRRQGAQYAGSFSDAFKAKLEAAFRSLPEIQLHANSADADVKLQSIRSQLEELSGKRIGVDISEDEALAKLALLHGRLEEINRDATSVQIKADTTEALARIDEFLVRVRELGESKAEVKVDVDAGAAEAELAALDAETGSAAGGFSGLIAAGIALAPALIPVIAAVTAAVVALISILGAGILGVGVLALGFSGVIKGVQALDQTNKSAASSGRSAASSALQMAGAAQQVQQAEASLANTRANAKDAAVRAAEAVSNAKRAEKDTAIAAAQATQRAEEQEAQAQQALADARTQAAAQIQTAQDQLASASRNLTQAQQAETDAQTALTDARKTAQQQLEDLANQVVDGQNAQRQAVLDLQSAKDGLTNANASPIASDQQRQQAQLTFDEATQRLAELQTQNQRLADQKAAADAAGVEGSQVVTAAQRQLQQATQGVADAQDAQTKAVTNLATVQVAAARSITDAQKAYAAAVANANQVQVDGQKKILAAQQQVSDALRSQATEQRQSAFSIAQALNAVASAHRAVASAGLGGSVPATSALTNAFDKLDPATQKFVRFIHDQLEPAFKTIQGAAAKGLLPGVEAGLKLLLPVLPGLAVFVGKVASALGEMFLQGAKTLKDPFWTNFFGFVEKHAIPALQGIFTFLLDVATGFAGLVQAFLPVTATVGGGLLDLASSFAAFGESAASGKNDSFNGFLAYVQQALPAVVGFIGDLAGVVGEIITVFRPWGDLLLTVLDTVAKLIVHLGPTGLAFILTAVGAVVIALGGPISVLIAAFTAVGGGALYIYQNVKPVHDFIDKYLLPKFHELSDYFTTTVLPILEKIGGEALDGIKAGIKKVADAINEHKPELEELYGTFKQAAEYIVEHVLPLLGPTLKTVFTVLGGEIASFITIVSAIVDAFDAVVGAAPGIWDDIHHFFSLGIHDVLQLVHDFVSTLNQVLSKVGVTIPNFTVPGVFEVTHGSRTGGRNVAAANGTVLPGYAPGIDSVPAMLSPGEAVMVPEFVRMVGSDWIHRANAMAMRGRRGAGGGQHFGIGGIVSTITGGLSSLGGAIAGSVVNPLISTAENAAHSIVNSTLGAGIFRDMANGTISLIGDAAKFANGGVVSPIGLPAAPAFAVVAGGETHNSLTVQNYHRPMTPGDLVTGFNQHAALYGRPMFVGSGV